MTHGQCRLWSPQFCKVHQAILRTIKLWSGNSKNETFATPCCSYLWLGARLQTAPISQCSREQQPDRQNPAVCFAIERSPVVTVGTCSSAVLAQGSRHTLSSDPSAGRTARWQLKERQDRPATLYPCTFPRHGTFVGSSGGRISSGDDVATSLLCRISRQSPRLFISPPRGAA